MRYVLELLTPRRRRKRPAGTAGRTEEGDPNPIRSVWRPFHAAYRRGAACYVPAPYAGRAVLFRCAKESKHLFDPRMLWRGLALGGWTCTPSLGTTAR